MTEEQANEVIRLAKVWAAAAETVGWSEGQMRHNDNPKDLEGTYEANDTAREAFTAYVKQLTITGGE